MKEFTAKQMHNAPAQVFRAADRDGKAKIDHKHYKDRDFFLTARDREPLKETCAHVCDEEAMICSKCGEQCLRINAYQPTSKRLILPPVKISMEDGE